nr:glycine betaine ABC transport system, ATP-binding protein OpuAA [Streptococcus thermophilus]
MFQAYSLFPHMDAVENVAYGLKIRGVDAGARRKRAEGSLSSSLV